MIKFFNFALLIPIFISIFISVIFIPIFNNSFANTADSSIYYYSDGSNKFYLPTNISFSTSSISKNFIWPTPGYSKITSKFGYRSAPTIGAGTYHGGIDIAAPENSSIISVASGVIKYVGWYGANGYTVIIEHENNYESIYGHVSPTFLVSIGDYVKKGELIARVGPKYVDKKSYTTYRDSYGKYTNGATTRSSFAFCYYKR